MVHGKVLSIGLASVMLAAAAASGQTVTANNAQPFSHEALIPANSDVSSIRLARVKRVRLPVRIWFADSNCEREQTFRDPGGSAYCQPGKVEWTEAYELSYSYSGQPLASDEYAGRKFTFSIYFRPEEISPEARQELSQRKTTTELSEMFGMATSNAAQLRAVVDERNSRFCEGFYLDGAWSQPDQNCRDEIRVKTVTAPADYVTVRVSSQLSKRVNP